MREALALADRAAERIPTRRAQPLRHGGRGRSDRRRQKRGRRLRLYYAAQVERRPPRFAIQVNDRKLIDRGWAFHLENRLREAYGLQGVPLVIDYVPRKGRNRSGDARGQL